MSVAIIDYGSGNLHSAAKAFERAARAFDPPEKILVTRDPDQVWRSDRVVLPGVGAAGNVATVPEEFQTLGVPSYYTVRLKIVF